MKTLKVSTYSKGKDIGYIGAGTHWWFDEDFPHAFSLFDLDTFYQEDYFKNDHVDQGVVKRYVDYILTYGKSILGRDVKSVLELGGAGGWFTEEFIKRHVTIFSLEGSKSGYRKIIERIGGKYKDQIIRHDFRLPIDLHKQFDMAICTEVAEHIEPPFSSQLIQTLTSHSKIIWFSFEAASTNEQHYHHSNEQPEKFWQNLFAFYHFNMLRLPGKVYTDTEGRGGYIFYHESIKIPARLRKYIVDTKTRSKITRENTQQNTLRHYARVGLIMLSNKLMRMAKSFS